MKFSVEILAQRADLARIREIYFSQTFNTALAEATGLLERTQIEHVTEPGGRTRTRTRVVPDVGLPAPVQKLLRGQTVRYDEISVYDPATHRSSFSIRSIAGKTVRVDGELRFIEQPGGVRITFEGEARIAVFGLGGMLERFLVSEVMNRYRGAERVLQEFVDGGEQRT